MPSKTIAHLEAFARENDWANPSWVNEHALFDAVISASDEGEVITEETFMAIAKTLSRNLASEENIDSFYKQFDLLTRFYNHFKQANNVIVVKHPQS